MATLCGSEEERARKEGRKGSMMDRKRIHLRDEQRMVRIDENTTIKRPTKRLQFVFLAFTRCS